MEAKLLSNNTEYCVEFNNLSLLVIVSSNRTAENYSATNHCLD